MRKERGLPLVRTKNLHEPLVDFDLRAGESDADGLHSFRRIGGCEPDTEDVEGLSQFIAFIRLIVPELLRSILRSRDDIRINGVHALEPSALGTRPELDENVLGSAGDEVDALDTVDDLASHRIDEHSRLCLVVVLRLTLDHFRTVRLNHAEKRESKVCLTRALKALALVLAVVILHRQLGLLGSWL